MSIVPSSGEGNEQAGCLPHSVRRRRLNGREHSRNKFEIGGANVPQLNSEFGKSGSALVHAMCIRVPSVSANAPGKRRQLTRPGSPTVKQID